MTQEQKAEIRVLWETTPLSGRDIAARFGITKNRVIGMASQGGWISFNSAYGGGKSRTNPLAEYSEAPWPYERTTMGRLDALHKRMDEMLVKCRIWKQPVA